MEGAKYLVFLFLFLCKIGTAQINFKKEIYQAFISNDMNKWKNTINLMNQNERKTTDYILELVNYQYGYIAWCIGNQMYVTAESYLKLAESNLKVLEKHSVNASLINAYQSAFFGFRIGLNRIKAPIIGPKSVECAKKAMQLDKNNPLGFIQYANIQYYMPPAFGGSKAVALDYYKIAESKMEGRSDTLQDDWNYLNLLVIIVKAYADLKDIGHAKLYCEKILQIEPDFLWVKKDLYPKLLKNKI